MGFKRLKDGFQPFNCRELKFNLVKKFRKGYVQNSSNFNIGYYTAVNLSCFDPA